MTNYRRVAAVLCTLLVAATFGLMLPLTASASLAHFRHEHREPLNDLRVTPGATFKVTTATICRTGYASSVRHVPQAEKTADYLEYGITNHATDEYEIDHLISLELGGSNAISNLWPELNDHPRGYLNSKDILENRLHRLVCDGAVALPVAQHAIATDWVSAYHRYLGTWPTGTAIATPRSISATTTEVPSGLQNAAVKITSLTNPVLPGETARLTTQSRPLDTCRLSVTLPSGNASESKGLGATTATTAGVATWTWKIGTSTGRGTAHAFVQCSTGSASKPFTIT